MLLENKLYLKDLDRICKTNVPWEKLYNSKILVTGATGLIGSFLVDLIMYLNKKYNSNITIVANGSSQESIYNRFSNYFENDNFIAYPHKVENSFDLYGKIDYIIHAASNAHPQKFVSDPVGTMSGNFIGLLNVLNLAKSSNTKRVLYVSSGEVYGDVDKDINEIKEDYSGYIDNLSARSCYPISKRAAETLCVSYSKQFKIDTVIARPCHIYGPTATIGDSRVSAEFVRRVLNDNDIVLKSDGSQLRSYCYVADCVSALLFILIKGESSNAYNIASRESKVSILEMANTIAKIANKKVTFEKANEAEKSGYNPMKNAVLDPSTLEELGWTSNFNLYDGFEHTIKILSDIQD